MMSFNDHYVIIGNGPAGNHAAKTLRKKDKGARITIISDEMIPYYYKPKLTGFIADEIAQKDLLVTSLESYKEKDIRVRLGQAVEQIDPDSKSLVLKHMETIKYSKLIIATGSRERLLPFMSGYADHLKFITSYTDVMDYKDKIQNAKEFFIFGGDLVGFKFLKMLNSMGKKVTILIYPNAFWPYNLTEDMLDQIFTSLSQFDVSIIIKDDISTIDKKDNGSYRIKTLKGVEKTVDMVFSFNGLVPDIDFVKGSGIDTDYGILVNEYLKTNIDGIYACGSCAQIYNPDMKSYSASIGWPNAVVQGEVAAYNLLGDHKVIESVGRKYFDLEGVKIKTTWWGDINDASQE
ncbi:MAG: FAD-dependent oxidoreductase [Proteobacteria bacterium]|nr:FAD-dependent oxidoreductase [Pseudomonadota bacterium]